MTTKRITNSSRRKLNLVVACVNRQCGRKLPAPYGRVMVSVTRWAAGVPGEPRVVRYHPEWRTESLAGEVC
eukprot:9396264-Pyramimonas_sp.AAC.1